MKFKIIFLLTFLFLTILPTVFSLDYNLTKNLTLYYDFESTAKAVNIFGYLFNGTIVGTNPSSTLGILGNAWAVVGTTRITLSGPNFGKVFSSNFWIIESSFDTGGLVMGGNAPFMLYWDAGNGAKVYSNTGGAGYAFIDGTEDVVNSNFVMWTYTRSQTNFSVYRNSVYKGSATLAGNANFVSDGLMGYPDDTSYDLKGKLDDYSFWTDKVLTQDDITYLYHGGIGRSLVNYSNISGCGGPPMINDSMIPVCSGLTGSTEINGTIFNWNSTCTDENFFSFNMTCTNGFAYSKNNINLTSWNFVNQTTMSEGLICSYKYCDGHTKQGIKDMAVSYYSDDAVIADFKGVVKGKYGKDIIPVNSINSVVFDNIPIKVRDSDIYNIDVTKQFDRYTFCFDFQNSNTARIPIPEGCTHLNNKWSGHLVCPDQEVWIDFVNPDVKVSSDSSNLYLDLSKVKDKSHVCFSSIGKFNCVTGTQAFTVIVPPKNSTSTLKTNYCPDTTPSVLILAILVFVVLTCLVLGLIFHVGVLAFISGIGMWVLAFTVVGCSVVFGVMFMLIGIVILILSIAGM